jgi:CheY-like chemotaxis protein
VASNGFEALEYLRRHAPPALILLDLMMPVMDGYAFRAEQLAHAAWSAIPTIILSANASSRDARQLGAAGWLRKPVTLDRLLSAIEANTRRLSASEHRVRFYRDPTPFVSDVCSFIEQGVRTGEAVVLVLTPENWARFRLRLEADAVDLPSLQQRGRLCVLDAEETLTALSSSGRPNAAKFDCIIKTRLEKAARSARGSKLRAYGEMVSLLWARGDAASALELERLWNDLLGRSAFSLYCSYFVEGEAPEVSTLSELARAHSTVVFQPELRIDASATGLRQSL